MKQLIALIISLLALPSLALDNTDTGTYAIVNRDGIVTDFSFCASLGNAGWNLEQKRPDGSWTKVPCEKECQLRNASAGEIQRYFPSAALAASQVDCIQNSAFAFCRFIGQASGAEHAFIALNTPKPTAVRLKKLSDQRK